MDEPDLTTDPAILAQALPNRSSLAVARQRRKTRHWDAASTRNLLRDAPIYSVSTTRRDGTAVLRHLNGVCIDDWVLFHGALAGEKMECLGRSAVVATYEAIATIPSYFFDPQLACPATTYFKSAMGHGTLAVVEQPELKSRMLQALMEKYQPEGGHAHFVTEANVYEKELKSVSVFGVRLEHVSGKINLGHDRPIERTRRVVEGLFERGMPSDLPAIESILEYSPDARPETWVREVDGSTLCLQVHPSEEHRAQHAELLEHQYWRKESTKIEIMRAIAHSSAWVGVCDEAGRLVAAARATSDFNWGATISDVVVKEPLRGRGIGKWLMDTLLLHPAVKNCRRQRLGTLDAVDFYARFGFSLVEHEASANASRWMVRRTEP